MLSTAVQLSGKNSAIWLEWAHLLLESGTAFNDEKSSVQLLKNAAVHTNMQRKTLTY